MALGIDEVVGTLLASVGIDLDVRQLYDTVLDYIKTGRLQIEDDQWFL